MATSPRVDSNGIVDDRRIGILTKTVIKSPVVRWLLHARLRHKRLNDLVFVGEDFVHVKEVGDEGHLLHIATKDDFDARIRAAKILSLDSESLDEDLLIKTEDGPSTNGSSSAPPQLLVLTLGNDDLVFLYLITASDGSVRWVRQSMPMPTFDRILYQPGEHLAVDPYGRALAVAANEREVVLYSAKTAQRIKAELQMGYGDWCPVSAQRPLQVAGVIQHMDFLIPPPDDKDHIILLLIVIEKGKTKAIWIDWYFASDLHHAQIHPKQPLGSAKNVSSLLIPIRNAAFMIISGSDVMLWKNILSGSAAGTTLSPLDAEPKTSGNSPRQPVWASWCRPRRSRAVSRDRDHIYLVREDGLVFLIHVMSDTLTASSAGHFECHVDTAFASLGDTDGPDVLAVAGDMSTGRVVSIGHWPNPRVSQLSYGETMKMDLTETVPNWASSRDMVTNTMRWPQSKSSRSAQSGAGLVVASGRQPYGTVTELRCGLEARLSLYFHLDGLESVTGTWAVPVINTGAGVVANGSVLMILTYPSATRILSMDVDYQPRELDALEFPALDLGQSTLAAACIADNRIVQVTRGGVVVTAGLSAHFEDVLRRVCEQDHHIVAATIEPSQLTIVMAEQKNGRYFICSIRPPTEGDDEPTAAANDGHSAESTMELDSTPTTIASVSTISGVLAAIGTTDGHIIVFKIQRDNTIRELCRTMMPSSQDVSSVCDYLVLQNSNVSPNLLATCGLRDGRLHAITLEPEDIDKYQWGVSSTIGFGQTAPRVIPVPGNQAQAYAMSGADTCLLSWDGKRANSLVVSNVWISDKERPELAQGPVVACTNMPQADCLAFSELAECLLMVSGDEILITSIQPSPTTIPRQLPVSGTPNRLLYSEQQRCFVVASTRTAIRPFPTPASRPEERRQVWPAIEFIPSRSNKDMFTYNLSPGQRIHALLEWSFRLDENKSYSFILAAGSRRRSDGSLGGQITFLQPINRSWEVVDVKVQEGSQGIKKFDAPVYALALYDELTYVVCYGRCVMLYRFSVAERRWEEVCAPYKLASPGVFVTAAAPLLYVSTSEDSLVVLELRIDRTIGSPENLYPARLVPAFMSPRAHDSTSHLVLPLDTTPGLAILSTKRGQLVGLSSPVHDSDTGSHPKSADILFEARLPRSLIRLRRDDIRPKWKSASPPGVLTDDIVSIATDGTLVGVAVLDSKLWRRLFWLQRLCEWSEVLSPHSYEDPAYSADVDHARNERALPIGLSTAGGRGDEIMLCTVNSKSEDMHLDGDTLTRILEHGGAEALTQLVKEAAERHDRIGEWVREHIDAELAAVDGMIELIRTVLDRWI